MKISINDENILWAFCQAIGEKYDDFEKAFDTRSEEDKINKVYDIDFKINGQEANFGNIINALIKQYFNQVNKTAKELLLEQVGDLVYDLEQIKEKIDNLNLSVERKELENDVEEDL